MKVYLTVWFKNGTCELEGLGQADYALAPLGIAVNRIADNFEIPNFALVEADPDVKAVFESNTESRLWDAMTRQAEPVVIGNLQISLAARIVGSQNGNKGLQLVVHNCPEVSGYRADDKQIRAMQEAKAKEMLAAAPKTGPCIFVRKAAQVLLKQIATQLPAREARDFERNVRRASYDAVRNGHQLAGSRMPSFADAAADAPEL